MYKRQSSIRREPMKELRGGVGVTIVDHILEKTEIKTNCRMFTKMTLEPGASIGYHKHEREEDTYYILSGIATVRDNSEKTFKVYPGEVVCALDGESHSIANDGDIPLEFISIILTYDPPQR